MQFHTLCEKHPELGEAGEELMLGLLTQTKGTCANAPTVLSCTGHTERTTGHA